MPDADPLGGSDPYEKLGVTEQMTVEQIKKDRDDLVSKYKDEVRRAKQNDDNDLYRNAQNVLREIDDAWDWIQKNHEPPEIDKEVSISAGTREAQVGDTVTFEVTSEDGPEGDVPVEVDGHSLGEKTTAADGTVDYTFDEAGTAQVTALTTPGHADPVVTVEVKRRPVSMTFGSAPEEVEIGERATFEVTDGSGTPVESAELRADGDPRGTTDVSGTETMTFEDVGTVQVTATKEDDDTATYADATTTVTVTEETVPLNLDVDTDDLAVGDTVTVGVTEAGGTPVEGARVSVDGTVVGQTTGDGSVEADLPMAPSVEVVADKSARPDEDRVYEPTAKELSPDKRDGELHIDVVGGQPMEGDDLELTVTDGTGHPVEEANISTNWDHSGRTNGDGKLRLSLDEHGTLIVKATKSSPHTDYGRTEKPVEVEEFTRQLRFDEIPDTAEPGQSVRIRVIDQVGTPVEDAEVRTSWQFESWFTDSDGVVDLSLPDDTGVLRVTAEKDEGDFKEAMTTDTIHVLR